MAVDFKKTLKHLYAPKNKPCIVNVDKANYIAVRGSGDPNDEDSEYKELTQKSQNFTKFIWELIDAVVYWYQNSLYETF